MERAARYLARGPRAPRFVSHFEPRFTRCFARRAGAMVGPPGGRSPALCPEEYEMEELIKVVSAKAGISEDQARSAVQAVVGFLRERLPAPLAGQVEGLLSSGASVLGGVDVGAVTGALGGLFGKK